MFCPFCQRAKTVVVDSRTRLGGGAVRRRRTCPACQQRFTTYERLTNEGLESEKLLLILQRRLRRLPAKDVLAILRTLIS